MSEWAASERMASEPESAPTAALAAVSPAETATELSATRSFTSCIGRLRRRGVAGRAGEVNASRKTRITGLATDPAELVDVRLGLSKWDILWLQSSLGTG